MEKVKVSVIIPCYNYACYLTEAVESVINQTYKNFEIIIVNDGSTDNTKQVAEGLIKQYPDYAIEVINQENKGVVAARNIGVKKAKGQYILCLDADDKIEPTYLEKTVKVLDTDPEVGFVYTWIHQIGEVDRIIKQDPAWGLDRLKTGINHIHSATIFRKKAWQEVEGFNPNMLGCEDLDFWISILEKGYKGKLIEEPLTYYRIHKSSRFQSKTIRYLDKIKEQIRENHPNLYK